MEANKPSLMNQKLIETLVNQGFASEEEILEQWESSLSKDLTFREQLLKSETIKDEDFQQTIAQITGLEYQQKMNSIPSEFRDEFTEVVPIRFAKNFLFYPASITEDKLEFAVVNPWPTSPYDEAANALGRDYSMVLSSSKEILEAINRGYDRNADSADKVAEVLEDDEDLNDLTDLTSEETEDLLDAEDEEPIKKLMNSILFQSVKTKSSDIHIDPGPRETVVRSRIDGVLHQITKVPRQGHIPLLNRVKVMSGLDISMKNQPQDGRTMILMAGKKIDIRVSIIPTVHGEQAVLRLLNQSQGIIDLGALGISPVIVEHIIRIIHQPHGIFLVTGPTGSGKTTTLYSSLNQLDAKQKNIVTIEDPVEYRIENYGQMQVNEKIGVTFAKGLRAMLRQDPDVIMVGEIRDTETAQIAIQASLTGHFVLSTLHTNDAVSSVIRLIDMGVEPFLVTSTVTAVIAQRLVRKICDNCKESYDVPIERLKGINFPEELLGRYEGKLWHGVGCEKCMNTGYQGRLGVHELLLMNDEIRQAVMTSTDASTLKKTALDTGMISLNYDCAEKVLDGRTTLDEMLRVVFTSSK